MSISSSRNFILLLEKISCCSILTICFSILILSLIILSNEETRSRSTERSPTGAPTAPTAPRIPSVVVQIPCAAARVQYWTPNSQGDRKKTEKTEKEKKRRIRRSRKRRRKRRSQLPRSLLVISSVLGHLWVPRLLLLSAMGHLWVPRTMQQQQQNQLHPQFRVAMPAPSSTTPEDWIDEMRREIKALMKDSMREMMALLPEPNPVTALGSGSHGAQSPPVRVPRDANFTNPILFAEVHAMAPSALHTGGDSLPVGLSGHTSWRMKTFRQTFNGGRTIL